MPGNEVGDRVHNFFEQQNLSQGLHHSQVVDGNWPVPSNNQWVGNQRQINGPLSTYPKNYHSQQSDSERSHGSQSLRVPHGLNYIQLTARPDFSKNQSQNEQLNLNGFMHGHQAFQTRQNEGDCLALDAESDRHYITSSVTPPLEPQQGNGPKGLEHNKKNSRLETSESPINFDFFGGQQQMNGQHLGMLQAPRQQFEFSDAHLVQQHVIFKKMQEFRRQQQLQQLEARQQSSLNQLPLVGKQAASHLMNGTPVQTTSNYSLPMEPMGGDSNWFQRGASPSMQGSSNGPMFPREQGQGLLSMGSVPRQVDQSQYGAPVSSTRSTLSQYSLTPVDNPGVHQISASTSSFPGNQLAALQNQLNMQDGNMVSRQGFHGKNIFENSSVQGLNSEVKLEIPLHVNAYQSSAGRQAFHGRPGPDSSLETAQGKTVLASSSQSLPTLDPTEEKILFGTDDNMCNAFGSTNDMLDGIDISNAFASTQSGTWSALMQSAVGETNADDLNMKEELSSFSFQNAEFCTENHQPTALNSIRKQPLWAENNLQAPLGSTTRSISDTVTTTVPTDHICVPGDSGHQQPGARHAEQADRLQASASHRSIQQSSECSKRLDQSPFQKTFAEARLSYASAVHSSDGENAKSMSGPWIHQQNIPSYNMGSQLGNNSDGWNSNFHKSVSSSPNAVLKVQDNVKPLHHSQRNDLKKSLHEEAGRGGSTSGTDCVPDTNVDMENLQLHREDSGLYNVPSIPDPCTLKTSLKTSQHLPNNRQPDNWKHVDSSANENLRKYQHLTRGLQVLGPSPDKGADDIREVEESFDKKENSSDSYRSNTSHHTYFAGARENMWVDASDSRSVPGGKQKSSGHVGRKTVGPRKFQYHPMGNLEMDAESSYGSKNVTQSQALSQQVYPGLKHPNQGHFGQPQFVGNIPKNSMGKEKVQISDSQADRKELDEVASRGTCKGYVHGNYPSCDIPVGNYAPNKRAQSSHMLDLLHKVDRSRESVSAAQFSNQQPEILETESSNGSATHVQRTQSSASHGFGLQLAPPSQGLPISNHPVSSQCSSWALNSLSSSKVSPNIGVTGHMWLPSTTSVHPSPSDEVSREHWNNNNTGSSGRTPLGIGTNFSHPTNQFQNQLTVGGGPGGEKVKTDQSISNPFDGNNSGGKQISGSYSRSLAGQPFVESLPRLGSISHDKIFVPTEGSQQSDTNQSHVRGSSKQNLMLEGAVVTLPSVTSGVSQQGVVSTMLPKMWTNVASQQVLNTDSSKMSKSQFQSGSNSEMMSARQNLDDNQDAHKGWSVPSEVGGFSCSPQGTVLEEEQQTKESPWRQASSENSNLTHKTMNSSQEKGYVKHLSVASPSDAATTKKEIEAFGHKLKPNNLLQQNYSFLHQAQAMNYTEIDPSNRGLKRFKGLEPGPEAQQVSLKVGEQLLRSFDTSGVRNASASQSSAIAGDSKMLDISSGLPNEQDNSYSQHLFGSAHPREMPFARNDSLDPSRNHNIAPIRTEHSQINPLMAPTWFDQSGAFNRQIQQMNDAHKSANAKAMEQQLIVQKISDTACTHHSVENISGAADTNLGSSIQPRSTTMSVGTESVSVTPSLVPEVTDQGLVAIPKKRKISSFEFIPWNKEVTQVSQSLCNVSMAETDWARAANRMMEKMGDELEMLDDGSSTLRPKRRLVLTSQLMQQLFRPPIASILSTDASTDYESVVYLVARLAIGDACSLTTCHENDMAAALARGNLLSVKLKTSERIGDEYFSKVVEDIISRSKKLEKDLLGLDTRASILDLRVECQDLERFSIINRFAKFHGRVQAEVAEASSSFDAVANSQKICLQRYVTALPMPRNLPDRVQCLSL